jgi:rod shape-determining protein MreB
LKNLFSFFSTDLAIDLGTANTLIYKDGEIVLNQPTIVAFNEENEIRAIGEEARKMIGKTHKNLRVERPMRVGAITNLEVTEGMLKSFIRMVVKNKPIKRVVVAVPTGINHIEMKAVRDACEAAGAREVHLVAEPMAAAIGAGLDVHGTEANLIVDSGGGTTEVALISLSGINYYQSVKVAGDNLTSAIIDYVRRNHDLTIGETTAENIKINIASAVPMEEEVELEVFGRSLTTHTPDKVILTSEEVRTAISDVVDEMIDGIIKVLENTNGDLSSDILERGILLSGGTSKLIGLDERIRQVTRLFVAQAPEPLTTVVRGVGKVLDEFDTYTDILLKKNRSF